MAMEISRVFAPAPGSAAETKTEKQDLTPFFVWLAPLNLADQRDADQHHGDVAEPDGNRRKVTRLGLSYSEHQERIVKHEDGDEAEREVCPEVKLPQLNRQRCADQHKTEAAKAVGPPPPGFGQQAVLAEDTFF